MSAPQFDVDAVVAGGGPAGCATAAELAAMGQTVLLVEAGVDRHKQLAGELLHPPGVEDLRALGFGAVLDSLGGQEVRGFAIAFATDPHERTTLLAYPHEERGLAAEHADLTLPLLAALKTRTGVTLLEKTRVSEVANNGPQGVTVTLAASNGNQTVRARLLVAADGRGSQVRKLLGISERHVRLSTMLGVSVDASLLPHPGYGHVFTAGPAPILAYATSAHAARVMVDLPLGSRAENLSEQPALLCGVPSALREAVLSALREQTPRMSSNDTRIPHTVVSGSAVLLGDAAGCCHPLSASGMASCTRDARALGLALREHPEELSRALVLYARMRRPPQRTRIALASALYQAFTGRGQDMEALRQGLSRYWALSASAPVASMALLSTREPRIQRMAGEYLKVVLQGLGWLAHRWLSSKGSHTRQTLGAARGLIGSCWPHLKTAATGAWEQLAGPSAPGPQALPSGVSADPNRASAPKT